MASRVFDIIWRINAIFIFVVGLAASVAIGLAALGVSSDMLRSTPRKEARILEDERDPARTFRLGEFDPVEGTSCLMAPLYSDQSHKGGFIPSSSGGSDIANYLFYDAERSEFRWLVEHNDYVFENMKEVRTDASHDEDGPVLHILFVLVPEDSDNDGVRTSADRLQVALADPSGEGFAPLLDGLDGFLGWQTLDAHTELVLYRADGQVAATKLDLAQRAVLSTTPLATRADQVTKAK